MDSSVFGLVEFYMADPALCTTLQTLFQGFTIETAVLPIETAYTARRIFGCRVQCVDIYYRPQAVF
jgi:hypothetical protein